MATYFMFGKYSAEGLKGISANRTQQVKDTVAKLGGKVNSIHALLGCHDLVLIVDLPGTDQAVKTSLALTKSTGIAFSTVPAISVEQFDKLAAS